ncbi:uncharacterized protein LACBIDRAFT_325747 [Laccaria bicolor S238N-H82]|uniref:Predicted protein n=1 Tax=Laccaria bicolor (strain S238N-H82 / ATCC MYA-4686) TaxID=486041 RepID=B0D635_LACBS|nr:uncharacterized protein LACBIDRAFT_325747 [Laccaria bicolor S238N-H82]EDR09873.1 predicted protein [Laccaria bicolor S238N-H82]|eukprot:XP_001879258.1 predicted protein [Laccaria bicolor S238N-H82]
MSPGPKSGPERKEGISAGLFNVCRLRKGRLKTRRKTSATGLKSMFGGVHNDSKFSKEAIIANDTHDAAGENCVGNHTHDASSMLAYMPYPRDKTWSGTGHSTLLDVQNSGSFMITNYGARFFRTGGVKPDYHLQERRTHPIIVPHMPESSDSVSTNTASYRAYTLRQLGLERIHPRTVLIAGASQGIGCVRLGPRGVECAEAGGNKSGNSEDQQQGQVLVVDILANNAGIGWWHDMVVNVKKETPRDLTVYARHHIVSDSELNNTVVITSCLTLSSDEEAYRRPLHHPGMTATSRQFSDTSAGQDALALWGVPLPPQYLPRTSHPSSPTSSIHSIYTQYDPNWCTVVPS